MLSRFCVLCLGLTLGSSVVAAKSVASTCVDYGGSAEALASLELAGPRDIEWQGSWAFVMCVGPAPYDTYVLRVMDMSDIEFPSVVAELAIPGCCSPKARLALSDSHAYVSNQNSIYVVDISDPFNPTLEGSVSLQSGAKAGAITVREPYVFATYAWTFAAIDVSNPNAPAIVGETSLHASGVDVEIVGDMAYVAADAFIGPGPGYGHHGSLQTVNISNPESLAVIDSVDMGLGRVTALEIADEFAYVPQYSVKVVDLRSFPSPGVVADMALGGVGYSLDSWGGFLYVGSSPTGGLDVIDITNPLSPSAVGRVEFGFRTFDVFARESGVLAASTPSGGSPSELMVWPLQCGAEAVSSPTVSRVGVPRLAATPNPFKSETQIFFPEVTDIPTDVRVFDIGGHLVRKITVGAGRGGVRWDGLDQSGQPAADGVYFVRLEGPSGDRTGKVVRAH